MNKLIIGAALIAVVISGCSSNSNKLDMNNLDLAAFEQDVDFCQAHAEEQGKEDLLNQAVTDGTSAQTHNQAKYLNQCLAKKGYRF